MAGYDFSPEVQLKILDALGKRVDPLVCPVCQHDKFTISNGWLAIPLLENFWMNKRGTGSWVFVGLACDHCGNTLFMNAQQLGVGDLVAPIPPEVKEVPRSG